MHNKYKKLLGNSVIFAIGNFGSKIMQFIMVPIYSYTLSTGEFGKVDILTSIVSLLSPVLCLDIFDGVFRFALDKAENKKNIFSTGILFTLLASILTLLISIFLISLIPNYPVFYTGLLLIISIVYSLVSNFARAMEFVKAYAIGGIINTFIMGLCNIIFLVWLKFGMNGYMLSMILGQLIATIYFFFATTVFSYIDFRNFNVNDLKRMLKYSIPLIPNNLAWWLNSTSDRLFILGMLGASANGIYAMANKIPSVITTFTTIFFQSWQMSVVEEYKKKNSKKFISDVFEGFMSILFLGSFCVLSIIRPLFKLIINKSYYSGWQITPFLILAVVYTSCASFLGTIYTASKKTVRVLTTTLYGGLLNILASYIFIKLIGIDGAAIANIFSFFIVSALRYRDIYLANRIKLNYSKFLVLHILFIVESIILIKISNDWIVLVSGIVIIILQLLVDKNLQKMIQTSIKEITKKLKLIL